jgi:hypothetical protein
MESCQFPRLGLVDARIQILSIAFELRVVRLFMCSAEIEKHPDIGVHAMALDVKIIIQEPVFGDRQSSEWYRPSGSELWVHMLL